MLLKAKTISGSNTLRSSSRGKKRRSDLFGYIRVKRVLHFVRKDITFENFFKQISEDFRIVILLSTSILFLISCSNKSEDTIASHLVENLADTIYAGENRLTMLTDGTGGYYYDDALKRPEESSYGYGQGEYRLLAEWKIANLAGEQIDRTPVFSVVDPGWIERHFEDGLIERIEMPHRKSGIYIELKNVNRNGFIFTPFADFRHYETEENARYVSHWDEEFQTLSLARADGSGGWLAFVCSEDVIFRDFKQKQLRLYRASQLKGRPGEAHLWSPAEFLVESASATFAIGYGNDRYSAAENARFLINNREIIRIQREQWFSAMLRKINISCDDREFIRAFSWARLTLARLIYSKGDDTFLLTGLPDSPYPDGWFSCLTIPGMLASGINRGVSIDVLNSILSRQNSNELSPEYGMLPGQIREDGIEYRIPEIAGLAVLAYRRLFPTDTDTLYADRFATSIAKSLLGTMKYRLRYGIVYSNSNQNFLWDSPACVDRAGATIETQVLLFKVREFLKVYPRLHNIPFEIPFSLILGSGGMDSRSLDVPLVTVGEAGEYNIPLSYDTSLMPFKLRKDKFWADRQIFPSEGDKFEHPNPSYDSRGSIMLALDWYDSGNHRRAKNIFKYASENELIGEVGFRTLSPFDENYSSTHVYLEENSPKGTKSKGDVLVWSGGILGNILANAEQPDSLMGLLERMTHRIIHQGVTGALPTAEIGETVDVQRDIVGCSVHAASTAEYVRLVTEYLLGIEPGSDTFLTLKPRFPAHWGKTKLEVMHVGGVVILERDNNGVFKVCQRNINPYLQLALEIFPEPGKRALGSVRLHPEEKAEIEFVPTDNGRWTSKIRKNKKWQ